jgi:hypothetical protein
MIRALVLALALAATTVAADDAPSPVTVHAVATPDDTTIGTRIRYEVTVSAPEGIEVVVAQPAEKIGDMDIVDFGTVPASKGPDGRVAFTRWWQLVAWTPGHHLLTSPPVRWRVAGGELADAKPAEIGVTVASLLEKQTDAADIRDIKPPDPIPVDWRPYYAIVGVLALLVVTALGIRWLVTRRTRPVRAAPPTPADEIAHAALEALRARALIERGAFKEFYSALTDIVRRYLEDRFHVRAPEMTTEEFLVATSRDGRLAPAHRRLLGEFLVESDLVKFAKHVPTGSDSERAFDAARRFVDETTERAGASPSPSEAA